jgi:glycosyltransferase involved in cell wall biosynthesis
MRIGIDMSRTAETKTGLASYAISLVTALARVDRVNRYVLHPYSTHCFVPAYRRAFRPDAPNFRFARRWLPPPLVRWLWRTGRADKDWLVGAPSDVFFAPFHGVPTRWLGRLVCTLHDVAFRVHPEFSTDWNRQFCETQFELARRRAERVIAVSAHGREELVRHAGIARERIDVVLEAADPRYRVVERVALPPRVRELLGGEERFTLFVGSVEPRKNLLTLVRAYARLRAPPPLLIAGGSGWKNSDVFAEVDRLRLGGRVRFLGLVTDDELVALYNRATAFVFPTIYEGFGLPVIEALACGAPVLTTRVASIPEVGGDAVLYCEQPRDELELARNLERLLDDDDLRASLRARGPARAAGFSWDRAARETLAVFEKAHRGAQAAAALVVGEDERAMRDGFFAPERADGFSFAWIGPRATLRLRGGTDAPLAVEAATPASGQTLTVRDAGAVVARLALQPGTWRRYDAGWTAGAAGERDVTLEVAPLLRSAHKRGDPRPLGVMVRAAGFLAPEPRK